MDKISKSLNYRDVTATPRLGTTALGIMACDLVYFMTTKSINATNRANTQNLPTWIRL